MKLKGLQVLKEIYYIAKGGHTCWLHILANNELTKKGFVTALTVRCDISINQPQEVNKVNKIKH